MLRNIPTCILLISLIKNIQTNDTMIMSCNEDTMIVSCNKDTMIVSRNEDIMIVPYNIDTIK